MITASQTNVLVQGKRVARGTNVTVVIALKVLGHPLCHDI